MPVNGRNGAVTSRQADRANDGSTRRHSYIAPNSSRRATDPIPMTDVAFEATCSIQIANRAVKPGEYRNRSAQSRYGRRRASFIRPRYANDAGAFVKSLRFTLCSRHEVDRTRLQLRRILTDIFAAKPIMMSCTPPMVTGHHSRG